MNDPKGSVAKVTCPTFEAMGQIPAFYRTYFLLTSANRHSSLHFAIHNTWLQTSTSTPLTQYSLNKDHQLILLGPVAPTSLNFKSYLSPDLKTTYGLLYGS